MTDTAATHRRVETLVGEDAGGWDLAGAIPRDVVAAASSAGVLCPQVDPQYGGLGYSSMECGELTALLGSRCSSLRSLATSQGMVAWTVGRFGDPGQRKSYLTALTSGTTAAVAFSEPQAGSDLAAMSTRIRRDGDTVVVDGLKVWTTGAAYAGYILVFGLFDDGAAAAMVPADAPGVGIEPVSAPMGCRAAGHAQVRLENVRLPAEALLSGAGMPLSFLVTTALTYGRLSVAWGCVGIIRSCLRAAAVHARQREQFGVRLADHQMVAAHLSEIYVAERTSTAICEQASRSLDGAKPDFGAAAVLAKQVAATSAVRSASAAVQVLGSAGAQDGHPVARAYRDAKLMELIEGTTELSAVMLAQQAMAA